MRTAPISRRRALSLLALGSIGMCRGSMAAGTDYGADVEFLLAEFARQAGHFFVQKGIDWEKVSQQFRTEAKAVADDAAHVKLCTRLVARLRDGHAWLTDLKVKRPPEGGGRRFTGPRVHIFTLGESAYVRQAFGSAQEAGLSPGMQVEAIDDIPIAEWLRQKVESLSDATGYSTRHAALYYACHTGLADWEGTSIRITFRKGDERKQLTLVRRGGPNFVPIGPIFPPAKVETIGRQSYGRTPSGNGYIHLRDIPGDLPAQLDKMLGALATAPALVLDFRANGGGGCDHEAAFGRFIAAGKTWARHRSDGATPFEKSIVAIVDQGVRSAGETISGMFKEDGRALMIGEGATAGMSSQKTTITVPSGLFSVQFSIGTNMGRFNGGKGIEGIGVAPHIVTPYVPADLLAGVDTQIRIAEEWLAKGLPKERVPWEITRG